jgi:hypothetical protein
MALQAAVEPAIGHELFVADRSRRFVERIEQRCGVPLREDQPVVVGVLGVGEIVPQVAGEQHRHQIGR